MAHKISDAIKSSILSKLTPKLIDSNSNIKLIDVKN